MLNYIMIILSHKYQKNIYADIDESFSEACSDHTSQNIIWLVGDYYHVDDHNNIYDDTNTYIIGVIKEDNIMWVVP